MKRIFAALIAASMFAACGGKNDNQTVVVVDTNAIKQKAVQDEQTRVKAEQEEKARIAAANRRAAATTPRVVYTQPAVGSSANPVTTGSGTAVEQKKGMSSRAKDALIGGGAGAIAGGIIGHNIKGAVIGGAVGAGAGYIIGRSKDKKNGRIQPKD